MNSDQIIVLFKEKTIRRTWANAVRARFFGSLKSERTNNMNHLTREEAKTEVINYTALLYNSERLHSTL
jgi:transposase InsO family protein